MSSVGPPAHIRPPPSLPPALNAIRLTYMNLFNQILDNSININCICKTTVKAASLDASRAAAAAAAAAASAATSTTNNRTVANVFDGNGFLSDDDDDDENDDNDDDGQDNNSNNDARTLLERRNSTQPSNEQRTVGDDEAAASLSFGSENEIDMMDAEHATAPYPARLLELEYAEPSNRAAATTPAEGEVGCGSVANAPAGHGHGQVVSPPNWRSAAASAARATAASRRSSATCTTGAAAAAACDLTCFENLKYVNWSLRSCFEGAASGAVHDDELARFEATWASFRFLSQYPRSCDYYGTTVFHYAAADNSCKLLRCALAKYPDGVFCIDSKGMTPLMRAVQRNNTACCEYLLDETRSDLNGSSYSTYTPLWFAVSNGYTELVQLLLSYNASASIVDKTSASAAAVAATATATACSSASRYQATNLYNEVDLLIENEDHVGIRSERLRAHIDGAGGVTGAGAVAVAGPGGDAGANSSESGAVISSYLFSPLRASIVYARAQIMANLLEYGANVYELFGASTPAAMTAAASVLPEPIGTAACSRQSRRANDDYVNALKFFYRQFGPFLTKMSSLNDTTGGPAVESAGGLAADQSLPTLLSQPMLSASAAAAASASSGSLLMANEPANEYDKCLHKLNDYIGNKNVYRRMLIEFVKSVYYKLRQNSALADRVALQLARTDRCSVEQLMQLTEQVERAGHFGELVAHDGAYSGGGDWTDYVAIAAEFMAALDAFLNSEFGGGLGGSGGAGVIGANHNEQQQQQQQQPQQQSAWNGSANPMRLNDFEQHQLTKKPNFHQNLFEFAQLLVRKYFGPKSLQEECRFVLRSHIGAKLASPPTKYHRGFLKKDYERIIVDGLDLPNNLKHYLLHV